MNAKMLVVAMAAVLFVCGSYLSEARPEFDSTGRLATVKAPPAPCVQVGGSLLLAGRCG
ncbi:hypothetical protein [Chthonobacter rhizosphaerae]|uniref:hypothetical protein n=1 Tax=Chthonobacter rhizosphaerae TaxID=2735553 RepID=UPI0015EF7D98|nr:hypothetical protein [Chthonobacter rhizosphaerae]